MKGASPAKLCLELTLLLLVGLLPASVIGHQVDVRTANSLDELKSRLLNIIDEHDVPGLAIALVEDNSVAWAGGIGLANRLGVDQVSATSSFRAASISKTITAIAILQLVESGAMKLSDPVQQLAPEIDIRNPWQDTDPVRVVHLLEHTAGFDDMHLRNTFSLSDDGNVPLLAAINRDTHALAVRWRPGSRFAYSNPGYAIAGYLVEKISGVSFDEYTQKRIFTPLGMKHSTVAFNNNVRSRVVQGYRGDGFEPVTAYPVSLSPAGGLITSAADTAILVRALLSNGTVGGRRLLRENSVTRMRQTRTGTVAGSGLNQGYGLGVYARPSRNLTWFGHAGDMEGFSGVYGYAPGTGVGYAILLNRSSAASAISEIESQLQNYLARNQAQTFPESRILPSENLDAMSGWYRLVNSRRSLFRPWDILFATVHVSPGTNELRISPLLAGAGNYLPQGTNTFRRESETEASVAFLDLAGPVRMVDGWREYVKVSSFSALAPVLLIVFAVLLLASAIILLPISTLFRFAQRKGRHPMYLARLLFFLSAVLFFAIPLLLAELNIIHLANWNAVTMGLAGMVAGFMLTSGFLFWLVLRQRKRPAPLAGKVYVVAGGIAGFLLSLALLGWGLVTYPAWAF